MKKLFAQALLKFTLGLVLVGALLFLPAGTVNWPAGLLFMGLLFLAMPLVLGSVLSFVCFLPYPLILARRIRDEEQLLEKELKGYADYKKKVKYRMVPMIW